MNLKRWKYIGLALLIIFQLIALVAMPTNLHGQPAQYQVFMLMLLLTITVCIPMMALEIYEFLLKRKNKQDSNQPS
jgi:quinol-cytochrome oxidoreductase complex cytochrome b subunit